MSALSEIDLKVPNVFRYAIPIVIRGAKRFFETHGSSVTGPERNTFVAGGPTIFTWMLRATKVEDTVDFELNVRANIDVKVDMDFRLKLQTPSGITVNGHNFEMDSDIITLKKDEWHVLCLACVEFSYIDQETELFEGNLYAHADVTCEIRNCVLPPPEPLMIDIWSIMEKVFWIHSDFSLIGSDGLPIRTHKLVLETVSPVFQAMFARDCQETREGRCNIPDFDATSISAMLTCILGADINALDFELLAKVFKLADKYEILPLKKKCSDLLAGKMSVEHVVEALILADQHSTPELKAAGFTFMESNWKKVIVNNVIDALRSASQTLYEEWQQRLDSAEGEGTSRKRAVEGASSDSPNKKIPNP